MAKQCRKIFESFVSSRMFGSLAVFGPVTLPPIRLIIQNLIQTHPPETERVSRILCGSFIAMPKL